MREVRGEVCLRVGPEKRLHRIPLQPILYLSDREPGLCRGGEGALALIV